MHGLLKGKKCVLKNYVFFTSLLSHDGGVPGALTVALAGVCCTPVVMSRCIC